LRQIPLYAWSALGLQLRRELRVSDPRALPACQWHELLIPFALICATVEKLRISTLLTTSRHQERDKSRSKPARRNYEVWLLDAFGCSSIRLRLHRGTTDTEHRRTVGHRHGGHHPATVNRAAFASSAHGEILPASVLGISKSLLHTSLLNLRAPLKNTPQLNLL
jgi:hypothetical protein